MSLASRLLPALTATCLLPACITFGPTAPASPVTSAAKASQLQAVLVKATGTGGVPGALALIDSPGKGPWAGAAGLADIAAQTPMQATVRFRIGSITKTFVAVALLKAADAGKLRLEAPITTYLPAETATQIPNAAMITVRHLLNHTSGLPDYVADTRFQAELTQDLTKAWQASDLLSAGLRSAPGFAPGAGTTYSNTNYTLAGMILETVSGKPFDQVIQSEILTPLALQDTSYPATADAPDPGLKGYSVAAADGTRHDYTRLHPSFGGAAGGMVSTARDLDTFAQALSRGQLLQAATQETLLQAGPATSAGGTRYTPGLERWDTPAGPIYGKTGGIYGGGAFVGWFADGTVVVTAVNEGPGNGATTLNSALMQALFKP